MQNRDSFTIKVSTILVALILAMMPYASVTMPTLEESSEEMRASPPGVGTTNLTVLNTTYLSGNQSYDDLYIGCGITSPCGSIISNGDLILTVNTLTVASGGSIIAYESQSNSQGVGTSVTLSSSHRGDGAGGAGHYGSGGSGGAASGNGGSSYGVGNESGSTGGSVYDSSSNLVSVGGTGGGKIVIYADVIEIYGTVDASGQDGEQGYRYQNGSGNGGSGAGGGSGGSIVMRANEVTIGSSSGGSVLANGGNGGDGADGDCFGVCIGLYDGGNGGGGGSGGNIDIQANSQANLMISSTATVSATAGSPGNGGLQYGTGTPGTGGSSGASGSTSNGVWSGWSTSSSTGSSSPNDMGTNADLPTYTGQSISSIPNFNFTTSLTGTGYADEVNDTEDVMTIAINNNEGIAVQITFNQTSTAPNGTTLTNDVEAVIADSNINILDEDISGSNTLTLSTNSSAFQPSGPILLGIFVNVGYVDWTVTIWKFSQSFQTQNDMNTGGDLGANLANTTTLTNFIFSGSLSGTGYADDTSDVADAMRVSINSNEGLTAVLTFPTTTTYSNGTTVNNDVDLYLLDNQINFIDFVSGNGTLTVTTNSTTTYPGSPVVLYIFVNTGEVNWTLDLYKFNVQWSSGNGTGGGNGSGNGTAPPSNCTGNGTLLPDILEPNDSTSTATVSSLLPIYCSGLSIDSGSDVDYFEVYMVQGVTYYVNVTFQHSSGDIDVGWDDASGSWLSSSGGTSNTESMTVTAQSNMTTYIDVYGYSGATNTYDIEITTNNPGGGQAFETVEVTTIDKNESVIMMTGLTAGNSYQLELTLEDRPVSTYPNYTSYTYSPITINATSTTEYYNVTYPITDSEGAYVLIAELYDSTGNTKLDEGGDWYYFEKLISNVQSSTNAFLYLTNMTSGESLSIYYAVEDANGNLVDERYDNITMNGTSQTLNVTWTSPTTMNTHLFYAVAFNSSGDPVGYHEEEFIPQLPAVRIDSYSTSTTSATNDVTVSGWDLVTGELYQYQIKIHDSGNATVASSNLTTFNATSTIQSLGTWTYNTPNASGMYCASTYLYGQSGTQLIGETDCFMLNFDNDGDGIINENDLCPGTDSGASVDADGCATNQKDSDFDGFNDNVDAFPLDSSQYQDTDGDGYGDNMNGSNPDHFPTDANQWSDVDGDGWGDNPGFNNSDAFPQDSTQWADTDGDGYGDNAAGNNPDLWPADSSQWTDSDGDGYGDNPSGTNGDQFPNDSTQWEDSDGDGYGDNANGNNPDEFPNDGTQWEDSDGDGYGDNQAGNNADAFPNDSTQWEDSDGDGYGDNQAGVNPDAFPNDSSQWADSDGDGYGDNQAGTNADAYPNDSTQWSDRDGDGYGDNISGMNPDHCPDTPSGNTVNSVGCAEFELDDDEDGVMNDADACPNTPAGEAVDSFGCSTTEKDGDQDGVADAYDQCPSTTLQAAVDDAGCAAYQLDTDNDGIDNSRDQCPNTTEGENVNGIGCSATQSDADMDGVWDADDLCPYTPMDVDIDSNGCADEQKDTDGDLINDAEDLCPMTPAGEGVDITGCSQTELDADNDGINDANDICFATPEREQVNQEGCSASQLDSDADDISDAVDQCPSTPEGETVDIEGCSTTQLDTDGDGVTDNLDLCTNTEIGAIVDDSGCSLEQKDSDGDGVNDAEDAFPDNASASLDSDGDGVADQDDAYPEDALRSVLEEEASNTGMYLTVGILLVIGIVAALLVVGRGSKDVEDAFAMNQDEVDFQSEAFAASTEPAKELPQIEEATQAETSEAQQWEENGVHWSQAADGTLSYWDEGSQSWEIYNQ